MCLVGILLKRSRLWKHHPPEEDNNAGVNNGWSSTHLLAAGLAFIGIGILAAAAAPVIATGAALVGIVTSAGFLVTGGGLMVSAAG
jgi:hypothetical protein